MFTLADSTPKIQASRQLIFSPDLQLTPVPFSQHCFLRSTTIAQLTVPRTLRRRDVSSPICPSARRPGQSACLEASLDPRRAANPSTGQQSYSECWWRRREEGSSEASSGRHTAEGSECRDQHFHTASRAEGRTAERGRVARELAERTADIEDHLTSNTSCLYLQEGSENREIFW